MASRGNPAFKKRQKELARKDKQKRKADRRAQRKLDNADSGDSQSEDAKSSSDPEVELPFDVPKET